MLTWPDKHFARFHDWDALRRTRLEQSCLCGNAIDPRIIDDLELISAWATRQGD